MRRTQRVLLIAALAAALALAGCTGGEGEVVIDGTGDPEADLAAAVEATLSGSGRFEQVDVFEMGDLPGSELLEDPDAAEHSAFTLHSSGTFDGANLAATIDLGAIEMPSVEIVLVEGRLFQSVQPEQLWGGLDPEAVREARERIGGARWIELPESDLEDGSDLLMGIVGAALGSTTSDPLARIADLMASPEQVLDDGTEVLDGVEHRRILAVLPSESVGGDAPELEPSDLPEMDDRVIRLMEVAEQYQRVELSVLISPEGLLRRLELTVAEDVPEQYRDCVWLGAGTEFTSTVDFYDLGSEVSIAAPDPAEVARGDAAVHLERLWSAASVWTSAGGEDEWSEEWTEADREYLEDELRTYADVIGLDPATISSMSIEQMGAASDRIWDAMDDLPTTETTLGDLSRPELLDMVKMGMEWLDIDPSTADAMTDEQLGAAIDAYLAENSGDLPGVEDHFGEEMFEGCPA